MHCLWAKDPLSEYVENIFEKARTSCCEYRWYYKSLLAVHELFLDVVSNLPKPIHSVAPFFMARSHASFLAAVTLALGGQTPECYSLLRGCIENALYWFYIWKNPSLETVWIDRHKGDEQRKACKTSFQMGGIMKSLQETDARAHRYVSTLYDRTIDRGAHPNMMSVFTMIKRGRKPNTVEFAYLTRNRIVLRSCYQDAIHIGLSAMMLYCVAYGDQVDTSSVRKEILRINKASIRHKKRYS